MPIEIIPVISLVARLDILGKLFYRNTKPECMIPDSNVLRAGDDTPIKTH